MCYTALPDKGPEKGEVQLGGDLPEEPPSELDVELAERHMTSTQGVSLQVDSLESLRLPSQAEQNHPCSPICTAELKKMGMNCPGPDICSNVRAFEDGCLEG